MTGIKRREFIKGMAGSLIVAGGAIEMSRGIQAEARTRSRRSKAKVVIIGGGAGGTAVASFIAAKRKNISVTIIEAQPKYSASFFSNHYLAGFRSLSSLTYGYEHFRSTGVDIIQSRAMRIEPDRKRVVLENEEAVSYDTLVLSPGVAFRFDTLEGLDDTNAAGLEGLHAWGNGGQVQNLRSRVLDMEDGDNILVAAPLGPCKGRLAIYERVSMLAHFCKNFRPASKITFLDPHHDEKTKKLFQGELERLYPGRIEWVADRKDAVITAVDIKNSKVFSASGQEYNAQILNIIPEQRAGDLVFSAGLTEGLWCPVVATDCRSALDKDIYVLGDAAISGDMPKTASSAFSQAQVVADSILARFSKKHTLAARYKSVCWPLIGTDNAFKFGGSYVAGDKVIRQTGTFGSSVDDSAELRASNYRESLQWLTKAHKSIFGV